MGGRWHQTIFTKSTFKKYENQRKQIHDLAVIVFRRNHAESTAEVSEFQEASQINEVLAEGGNSDPFDWDSWLKSLPSNPIVISQVIFNFLTNEKDLIHICFFALLNKIFSLKRIFLNS